jgi:hypothetical protein
LKGHYLYADRKADCLCVVSMDDLGVLTRQEAAIPLGERNELKHMDSASHAFLLMVMNPVS